MKKSYEYRYVGSSGTQEILQSDIPDWMKVLYYIVEQYNRHKKDPNYVFFERYGTIQKVFNYYGSDISIRSIENSFDILSGKRNIVTDFNENEPNKNLVGGGMELIDICYAGEVYDGRKKNNNHIPGNKIQTKQEYIDMGGEKNKYVYRRVYINYKELHKFISVMDIEDYAKKHNIGPKSRFLKLMRFFPMVHTATVHEIWKEVEKQANGRYKTENAMFYTKVFKYSSRYYNVKNLIRSFIPDSTINLEDKVNMEALLEWSVAYLTGTKYDMAAGKTRYKMADKPTIEIIEKMEAARKQENTIKREAPQCVKDFIARIR